MQAFDWLRGLAVLFMIQCHALVMLAEVHRTEPLFRWLIRLDGLVAPSFTFAAGFSLALVQTRGATRETQWKRFKKSARRVGEVLLVATTVNWLWFPIFREPKWLVRFDILHCIGLSLVVVLPLSAVLALRPRLLQWLSIGLAALAFAVSPLLEKDAGPFDFLLNSTTGAVFPLLPWIGYVLMGASAGVVASRGELRSVVLWLAGLGVVGAVLWFFSKELEAAYPPHNFWVTNPANCAQRWTIIMGVLLLLLWVEQKWTEAAKSKPVKFIAAFGSTSMAAYFFHETLLYVRLPPPQLTWGYGWSFDSLFHASASWPKYWALTALLIAITYGLVLWTDKVYRKLDKKVSGEKT